MTPLAAKVRALILVKREGYEVPVFLGFHGGNHVFKDTNGRLVGADVVVDKTTLYVGYAPRIEKA